MPLSALARADVITLRAMDEGMNTQQRDMYLNATSMLNNWWFRVAVRRSAGPDGGVKLTFEHPAVVGQTMEGWMDRMKAEGKDVLNPVFSDEPVDATANVTKPKMEKVEVVMTKPDVDRKITVEELKAQDKEKPWVSVVYTLSRFYATDLPEVCRERRSVRRHRLPSGPSRRRGLHLISLRRRCNRRLHGHSLCRRQEKARRGAL